jgi:hypothetical protein
MMSSPIRSPFTALVQRFLPRLRYPYLFLILGGLFLVDLVVPDPIPLVDELMLAMLTFLAGTLTTRKDDVPPPRDVTPDDPADRLSAGDRPRSPTDSSP